MGDVGMAPVYPTPALWLTDYLLAENLRTAYESRQAPAAGAQQTQAPAPQGTQNTGNSISPEIKQLISEEVKQQIAAKPLPARPLRQARRPLHLQLKNRLRRWIRSTEYLWYRVA